MKNLNNNDLYQLLHILKYNGNIKRLIRKGITYIKIVDYIKNLTKEGFVFYDNEQLTLTESGNDLLESLAPKYKVKDKDKWIELELKSKLNEKIELDFIYLPNQSKLYF